MQNPFSAKQRARLRAFFSKPANIILVTFCVLLCMLTLYPLILLFTVLQRLFFRYVMKDSESTFNAKANKAKALW